MINPDTISTQARREAITRLDRLCRQLRFYSILIIATTFVNIINSFGIVFHDYYQLKIFNLSLTLFLILFAFFVLIFALIFDYLRKEGDAYFEELSDELHGAKISNNEEVKNSSTSDAEFSLGARIIMRNYSNCSSLPLIPGRYGPALTVGVNLILSFLAVLTFPR